MKKALVVLSGGQDSVTCLYAALANPKIDEVLAITFNYGQRHVIEIDAAKKVVYLAKQHYPTKFMSHEIVDIPNILMSVSPLVSDSQLEQYENHKQMEEVIGNRVELTFVPMRNTLFMTIAFNRAVAYGCEFIYTGICQEDNANYPDCTELFRRKIELGMNCSLGKDDSYITISAPLMYKSKAETVKLAMTLPGCMEALAYSHTSYDGKYPPIDMNHANVLRAKGFEDAGVPDPLVVRAWQEGLMQLPSTSNYDGLRNGNS